MRIAFLLLLSAACWAQTIRDMRPRVLGTQDDWAAAAAKRTGTAAEQAQWTAMTSYIASFCNASITVGAAKQGCAFIMGAAYRMDPANYSGAFADKACALIKYQVDRDDGDGGGYLDADTDIINGNSWRWYGVGLAATWDMLQPHCDSVDPTVGAKVRFTAERAWEIFRPDSTFANGKFTILLTPYKVNNNIGIGQVESFVKLAAAVYEPGTYTDPAQWLAIVKTEIMDAYVVPCLTATTAQSVVETCYGGSWTEGMIEYAPETLTRMMDLVDSWRVATSDVDYWSIVGPEFPRYMADWFFRGTSPTGPAGTYNTLYQMFTYRDVTAASSLNYYGLLWFMHREAVLRLSYYFQRQADSPYDAHIQFWLKTIQPAFYSSNPPSSQNSGFEVVRLLMEDANSTGVDYRTAGISTDHLTPYMLLTRSSWDTDATWAGFFAMTEGGDHMHGDAGSFNIWRKGKWLTREIPGYLNLRHINPNASHNALTLNGHGTYSGAARSGGSFSGIPRLQRTAGGYKAFCGSGYCAAEADISPSYKFTGYLITPDVNTVTRNFLYIKPDFFVVADRIRYTNGVLARSVFHLQSEKAPAALFGRWATISNASQRLHVSAIAPSTSQFQTPLQTTCRVLDVRKLNNDTADLFADCGHGLTNNLTVRMSGITGPWSVLNGAWNIVAPSGSAFSSPFSDGVAYNGERFRRVSPGLFANVPEWSADLTARLNARNLLKDMRWNDPDINPASPNTVVTHNPYRLDIVSGRAVNEEAFFVVLEAADQQSTPQTVLDLSLPSANAATFSQGGQRYTVAAPTNVSLSFPLYFRAAGGLSRNLVMGLDASTPYWVTVANGVVSIDPASGDASYTSDAAGVLDFSTDTGDQLSLTLENAGSTIGIARLEGMTDQSCSAQVRSGPSLSVTEWTGTVESGPGPRRIAFGEGGSLTPGSSVYGFVSCGATVRLLPFTLRGASATQSSLPVALAGRAGAATARLHYGPSASLGSQTSLSCSAGCTANLTATSGSLLYWRVEYLNASGAVLGQGAIQPAIVP
ncbi:MAG: hypothetical protein J0L64_09175 [Acidobacteria bacterium]|nr:hypothetical protein [Acidobacteriota bacterium]